MGYIKSTFIDKLLERAHIDEVIGKYLELKRAGANFKAKSPFSDDKTASLMVSPVKNIWKDFSTGKGGNVVSFVMEKETCSYPEAIEKIAGIYNEVVEYEAVEFSEKKKEVLEKKEELRKVLKATHELYQKQLASLPEEHLAVQELKTKRQYSEDTILEWGIGFAPENFIYNKFSASGKVHLGEALGLIINQWDKYSNRVVYPIHDGNGLIIGLAGRDISGRTNTAKWINPNVDASNLLYNKSKVWYGLHKAKQQIRKRSEAFLCEGYNDVIAAHLYGLENTVASCGTAITEMQINEIKKLCTKVVFWMDPDAAGKAAVLKQIPLFMKQGFRTEVIDTDLDPDDFCRKYSDVIALSGGLNEMFKEPGTRKDGFKILLDHYIQGTDLDKSAGAKILAEIISKINDDSIVEIYRAWLAKESKVSSVTIKKWIKEFVTENVVEEVEASLDYILPVDVKVPLKELEKNIKHYGMFIANNQIYMSLPESRDGKVYFTSISNFSIEVLQHMNDEKFPRKLIRLKNIHGKEVIFDTNSENLNTPLNFYNTMSGHGNFNFKGSNNDLQILRTFLLDNMGDGRKIEVLGWQPDANIWVWNNRIINDEGLEIPLDDNGVFVFNDIHYYIASANKIYKHTSGKYKAQKQFRVMENPISFESYMAKVIRVHREHGISALLFAIASLFQDIAVDETGSFPILFFYGPGGSGKDELAYIVQSFAGIPQIPINLEAGASTLKAKIIELAQFKNGISQLSEYKRGDSKLDGTIKSIWDRVGYKKGSIESRIAMDTVDIESSVILTGNDYPNSEPLIIRLIWNEMTKNVFTQEEMIEFDELNDWTTKGVSGYAHHLLRYRKVYKANYSKGYRKWKGILQENFKNAKGRIISNLAVLATTFEIVRDMTDLSFPFDQNAMMDHFKSQLEQQTAKINSASIMIRFWDCFIASLRGTKDDRLQANYIVSVEENTLYIQWTHTMDKINRKWWTQYHELPPSPATFKDELKKSGVWLEDLKSHSFASGRMANRSSATAINMLQLSENVREDITGSIMYQLNEGTLWDTKAQETEADTEQTAPSLPFREINEDDLGFL